MVCVNEDADPREITLALTTLYLAFPAKSKTDFSSLSSASAFFRVISELRRLSLASLSLSISPRVLPKRVISLKKFPTGRKIVAAAD